MFLGTMLSSPMMLISLVFLPTMFFLLVSFLRLFSNSLFLLLFLPHLLLDIFQPFDCFWNEINLRDADFFLFDITSAIYVVLFVISFYVTEKCAFLILAWACDTTTLVNPVWVYFALAFPAACSLGAFANTFAPARISSPLLSTYYQLNMNVESPPTNLQFIHL